MRTAVKRQKYRTTQFNMRLTKEEREVLEKAAQEMGVSATDILRIYIRKLGKVPASDTAAA